MPLRRTAPGLWRLGAMLVAAVVVLSAAQEERPRMRIRLKAVEFDPLTMPEVQAPAGWDRWIVQVTRPLTRDEIERLRRDHGLELARYIPDGAYLERIDASRTSSVRRDPLVRALTPYLPEHKLDPEVTRRRERDPGAELAVVAEGYRDVSLDALLAAVQHAGYPRTTPLRVPANAAPRVRVLTPASSDLGPLTRVREVAMIEPATRMDLDQRGSSMR